MRNLDTGPTELSLDRDRLQACRHGMIAAEGGRVRAIHVRRFGRSASWLGIALVGSRLHRRRKGDRCYVYFTQPRSCPDYLSLTYVWSTGDCSLRTLRAAMAALDTVAQIKRSQAIVCDVWNWRISDRLLKRAGWEAHCTMRWHRNHIKRFYGQYPARPVLSTVELAGSAVGRSA